jgi:hypothetical protein
LLPAVQAAREAARRSQCKNNLKQIGLGMMVHLDTQKHFPSCGWGYHWTGDPTKGYGTTQPGGWLYNLLPFIEQQSVHDMALGAVGTSSTSGGGGNKSVILAQMNGIVISTYNCPSRRTGLDVLIKDVSKLETEYNADEGTKGQYGQARSDYAGNAGTNEQVTTGTCQVVPGGSADNTGYDGAAYYRQSCNADASPSTGWWSPNMNGVTFACSRITLKQITDGTTKTYFAGEKSLQPQYYLGGGPDDNGAMYEGHDYDVLRWGGKDGNNNASTPPVVGDYLPLRDQNNTDTAYGEINFGSAHSAGCFFVMCDGSVQTISYTIDPKIHWALSNRRDGLSIQTPN